MRIIKGNDLLLKVFIKSKIDEYSINVQSIRSYLVSHAAKERIEAAKREHENPTFVSRYPIEPIKGGFIPTKRCINGCGMFGYFCHPQPTTDKRFNPYEKEPQFEYTPYLAESVLTSNGSTVRVLFPAEDLEDTGLYDIMIVAKIYHHGYPNNLRTITLYYNDAFEILPEDSQDQDTSGNEYITYVDMGGEGAHFTAVDDIYVKNGAYVPTTDGKHEIQLNMSDNTVATVNTDYLDWGYPDVDTPEP